MSDSTYDDEPRTWLKERLKRTLVGAYSAAVVAGSRSRCYLRGLGFPDEAIFEPWDVVDNEYFATTSAASLKMFDRPYFLCISRYLPKKNLFRLVEAFAAYRMKHGAASWDLVILGSGELERQLGAAVEKAGVAAAVHRPGFVQYGDLPAYYHQAGACILPSTSDQWGLAINEAMAAELPVLVSVACGCCPDLVVEGQTGYSFDPLDVAGLSDLLYRMATLSVEQRRQMGRSGYERVKKFSPERFAEGLVGAVSYASRHPAKVGVGTRLILGALAKKG
jgi:glycosyltransferase involved in cell wall biosynthesis